METTKNEVWKDVEGYEDIYKVSNTGKVHSNKNRYSINDKKTQKGYLLKPNDNGNGYKYINLYGRGFKDRRYIHRLVAETFLSNEGNKTEVNHIDGDKSNNHVKNLEWVTPKENIDHALKNGLIKQEGAHSHFAKLNDSQAKAIKILYNSGKMSSGEIEYIFGVTKHTVINIAKGKSFSYLD